MANKVKALAFFILLISAGTGLVSCAKKTPDPTPTPTTRLQLRVMDASNFNGNYVQNPKAQLFKTNNDRLNKTSPVTPLITGDADGYVNFDNLEAIDYYYNAYNNDETMSNATQGSHTNALKAGELNKVGTSVK